MAHLAPLPGFDWTKVNWGGPDEPRTEVCSYCGDPFPDDDATDFVPLILWNAAGWCAEFCSHCQAAYWGIQTLDEPIEPRDEPEVLRKRQWRFWPKD
jgi:hypothetical protein